MNDLQGMGAMLSDDDSVAMMCQRAAQELRLDGAILNDENLDGRFGCGSRRSHRLGGHVFIPVGWQPGTLAA